MFSMRNLLSFTLMMGIILEQVQMKDSDPENMAPRNCGGRLKGPYGLIQTPNFPNAFPVPLKCKWIIEHDIANGTISVYFTQLYTTSGLTFTEYLYYDDTYKLGERRAFTVTEDNITRVKWLQVQSPVLVVELSVHALEGTQLRALGLLAVFGLNLTYAVRAPTTSDTPSEPPSCSALECRLLGHCYATYDYQQFFCSCFDGYSGEDCGVGPLCASSNMCKHGGACRQMGAAAVSCICAPGYTGDLCESQVTPPECGLAECSVGCKKGASCDCNPKDSDFSTARFETKLQIMDQPMTNTTKEVISQVTTYLRASNISLEDDIEILNISDSEGGIRRVLVRVWSPRRSASDLRSALARLSTWTSGTLRLLPGNIYFDMQPALTLSTLIVNQRPEVWEGSEFILSCTAYGSPDMAFTWYKDGIQINFNGTSRDIWTRTVTEDALGRRISVLGVSEAKHQDSGRWSCAADDAGRRRCRALWLTVLKPPDIRLMPSTLTVSKGENVSITCLAGAGRIHGALGFSWAREQTLLPLVPGKEVWEDLYPAGSVLKIYNIQKSSEYRCQVSSIAGTNAKGVAMWVLSSEEEACEAGASHGLRWPRTAPGAHASAACPPGHIGETSRFCEPKSTHHGARWKQPDFSGCVAESLKNIYEQFILISYGYSWSKVADVAHQYGGILRSLPVHPGEGSIPLKHIKEMIHYLLSSAARPKDRAESVEYFLKIYDTLLKHPDMFLDEEKTYELQNILADTAAMKDDLNLQYQEFSVFTKAVQEDSVHFGVQPRIAGTEEWRLSSVGVELVERYGNASVVAVQYHNLATRLPSLQLSTEIMDGREMDYRLASQHIQLSASGDGLDKLLQHTVTLLFTHTYNFSAVASKFACGVRSFSDPRYWRSKACEVRIPEQKHVACRCRGLGTYAVFTVARSSLRNAEKNLKGVIKVTVGLGGALCLVAAVMQLLGLFPNKKSKVPILLKATTAGTHSIALFVLLECDLRQDENCMDTLGWVCVTSWCVGCAALCAQPLLLQQELSGRARNAASVGLLAGVCILALLSARLWGGPPLQLGAAALVVWTAACALLGILCFVLAVCAELRLRVIVHKVPVEKINYLKDRQKIIRHTLMLLLTTTTLQAAGIAYVQRNERNTANVIALSAIALVNGIAMVVCYVLRDSQCLRAVRRTLSLTPFRHWDQEHAGATSLSLYVKQSTEVQSRGGVEVLESTLSRQSPIASYWKAPHLESPIRIHRRQSAPDTRAGVVRCVEYSLCLGQENVMTGAVGTTGEPRVVCDLIPRTHPVSNFTQCSVCSLSTPDVTKPYEFPVKSCLKKYSMKPITTSISSPSIEVSGTGQNSLYIEHVNREWRKAYESPDSDKVLVKISNDLNFLLNKSK